MEAQGETATRTTTVVSAPGKVLVTGGYLVLDRKYSGLVIATSSRFYAVARPPPSPSPSPSSSTGKGKRISIRAGQFPKDSSVWEYDLLPVSEGLELKPVDGEAGRNKFVEITVAKVVEYAYQVLERDHGRGAGWTELDTRIPDGLEVVVLADNDFYSQREQLAARGLPIQISSLDSLPPFCPLPRPIGETNKTGLGSSAALVTSITAAILHHLRVLDLSSIPTMSSSSKTDQSPALDTIHSVAQYAHCLAQGKVGSGFDIASAVYGSHLYTRFSPSLLSPLMTAESSSAIAASGVLEHMKPAHWDQRATPVRLPRGIRLLLADVDAGTDTPSFVGKVLKWRADNAVEANELWSRLDAANGQLVDALQHLVDLEDAPEYDLALNGDAVGEGAALDSSAAKHLAEATIALESIRACMREMSIRSGVPIEPPEQTRLLDACSQCPGVLGGGVPGAGGYDAIFLLVVDRPDVIDAVEKVWARWTEMAVCPLSARQSDGGLRLESDDRSRHLEATFES